MDRAADLNCGSLRFKSKRILNREFEYKLTNVKRLILCESHLKCGVDLHVGLTVIFKERNFMFFQHCVENLLVK